MGSARGTTASCQLAMQCVGEPTVPNYSPYHSLLAATLPALNSSPAHVACGTGLWWPLASRTQRYTRCRPGRRPPQPPGACSSRRRWCSAGSCCRRVRLRSALLHCAGLSVALMLLRTAGFLPNLLVACAPAH